MFPTKCIIILCIFKHHFLLQNVCVPSLFHPLTQSQWPTYGLSFVDEKCATVSLVMKLSDQNIDVIYEMSLRKQGCRQCQGHSQTA